MKLGAKRRAIQPDARPVAYVRKSTRGGADSRVDQIAGARDLAARFGDDAALDILDGDWAISAARDKTVKRLDFLRLLDEVEQGRVTALYATDCDRLARSVRWANQLADACEIAGVVIHTPVKDFDLSDESDRLLFQFAAMTNEQEVRKAQRKAAARVSRQRERNAKLGQAPYGGLPGEDAGVVLQAFRDAGSYNGAARLLKGRGIPSRRSHLSNPRGGGGMQSWSASTVKRIVTRMAPELVPIVKRPGVRIVATHYFQMLVTCPADDTTLTTNPRRDGYVSYVCRLASRAAQRCPKHHVPVIRRPDWAYDCPEDGGHRIRRRDVEVDHPRPWIINEQALLTWAKAETAGILGHRAKIVDEANIEVDVTALREKRERLVEVYIAGDFPKDKYDERIAELDAELDRLGGAKRATLTFRMGLDWSLPPGDVNARLRELWSSIRLGPDMKPSGAVWRMEPEGFDNVERVEGGWFLPTSARA